MSALEEYLIYLRKSRKDRELELQTGDYDTLERHRRTLLDLAKRRGYLIAHIYEEVVSGDTIADRPEMQKLLAAVETGRYAGVLVMEIPRLARGNTRDQGTVSEVFQYSGTKIITPEKIYDPCDESDEEYFEFGLFMSRREYKMIRRRLQRGRMASLSEGKYIAGAAPYGYRKVKLPHQRGYTLEPDGETADIVRDIFRLYAEGEPNADGTLVPVGGYRIALELNARGIPSPGGGQWSSGSVRDIIKNPTYAGMLRWGWRPETKKLVDGVIVKQNRVKADYQPVPGMHEPLVSRDLWNSAQALMHSRAHAPLREDRQITSSLSGLLVCSVCGKRMVRNPGSGRRKPFLYCSTPGCSCVSSRFDTVEEAVLSSLRDWLSAYEVEVSSRTAQQDAKGIRSAERTIEQAQKNLKALTEQKSRLYDLLEQGLYSQELFLERSHTLAQRISDAERTISTTQKQLAALRSAQDARLALIPNIQHVLDTFPQLDSPAEKNALLHTVLDHAVYQKSVGGRYAESDLKLYLYPKVTSAKDF